MIDSKCINIYYQHLKKMIKLANEINHGPLLLISSNLVGFVTSHHQHTNRPIDRPIEAQLDPQYSLNRSIGLSKPPVQSKPRCSSFGIIIMSYRKGNESRAVVLVGEEKGGAYQGMFNMFGGKGENKDNGDPYNTFLREVHEEMGIPAVDNILKVSRPATSTIMGKSKSTHIWQCHLGKLGVSRSHFRPTQEMAKMEFLDFHDLVKNARYFDKKFNGKIPKNIAFECPNVDNKSISVSSFLLEAVVEMFGRDN